MFFREIFHVTVRDAGIAGKKEHIPCEIEMGLMEGRGHDPLQLFGCEIPLFLFRTHGFIAGKRVNGDDTVRDGLTDDDFQLHGQVDDCPRREVAIRPQMQVIIVYERTVQCRKRDVRQVVLFQQEPLHMFVSVAIASQTAFGPVYAHPFCKVSINVRK